MTGRGTRAEGWERQRELFVLIQSHIADIGYPPTIRWLSAELGVSTSNVWYHLGQLERDGAIERDPGVFRGIRVLVDSV